MNSDGADLGDLHAAIAVFVVGLILVIVAGVAMYRTVKNDRNRFGR